MSKAAITFDATQFAVYVAGTVGSAVIAYLVWRQLEKRFNPASPDNAIYKGVNNTLFGDQDTLGGVIYEWVHGDAWRKMNKGLYLENRTDGLLKSWGLTPAPADEVRRLHLETFDPSRIVFGP